MEALNRVRCVIVSGLWDEIVSESGGFSPDAAASPARRQQTEQFDAGVMFFFCNPVGWE